MSSIIAIFVGQRGSGKTLSMVELERKMYNLELQNGIVPKPPVSNVTLNYEYEPMSFPKPQKGRIPWFDYHRQRILLDEAHIILESRTSSSKRNRYASYFVTQTRKRQIDLFCTTQLFGQVDRRLRGLVDFVVYCTAVEKVVNGLTRKFVRQAVYKAPLFKGKRRFCVRHISQEPIWPIYETDDVILPEIDE